MWQEAELAHTAAATVRTLRKKQRAPSPQVALKNAVLIICKLSFGAHVLHLAAETENAGPAVPSGWEQGSTKTQKGLREKDTLQWIQDICHLQRGKIGDDEEEDKDDDGGDDGHDDKHCKKGNCKKKKKKASWWEWQEWEVDYDKEDDDMMVVITMIPMRIKRKFKKSFWQ